MVEKMSVLTRKDIVDQKRKGITASPTKMNRKSLRLENRK